MSTIRESYERRFAAIHDRSTALIRMIDDRDLYLKPRELERSMAMFSCGEYILRSAAAVEQTSNGITTRLWDDPFEWTLPEKLVTGSDVIEYLLEVEKSRTEAFKFLVSDNDLQKEIPAPQSLRTIFDLLLDTVSRAEHYQGRAFAVFQMLSDTKLPRI